MSGSQVCGFESGPLCLVHKVVDLNPAIMFGSQGCGFYSSRNVWFTRSFV